MKWGLCAGAYYVYRHLNTVIKFLRTPRKDYILIKYRVLYLVMVSQCLLNASVYSKATITTANSVTLGPVGHTSHQVKSAAHLYCLWRNKATCYSFPCYGKCLFSTISVPLPLLCALPGMCFPLISLPMSVLLTHVDLPT